MTNKRKKYKTSLEVKKRHWEKKYNEAPIIECACGCGELIKSVDKYARSKKYVNGHNPRKYKVDGKFVKYHYKKEWRKRNPGWVENQKEVKRLRRKETCIKRKEQLIKIRGGKCETCGLLYNGKNRAVFDFHHENERALWLNARNLQDCARDDGKKWLLILEEVKKCKLLCANCHRLLHNED